MSLLYKQLRVGRNDKVFTIYKIRTMRNGIVTNKLCHWLRKWRIDELPQLFNILIGDMNLVGPRPLTPEDHRTRRNYYLPCKPGITGLWQINGCEPSKMNKYDSEYYWSRTLWLDLKIMIWTIPALIRGLKTNHQKEK